MQVKTLIGFGATVAGTTLNGNTALMLAACYGRNNVVEYFCETQATIEAALKKDHSSDESTSKVERESPKEAAYDLVNATNEAGQTGTPLSHPFLDACYM